MAMPPRWALGFVLLSLAACEDKPSPAQSPATTSAAPAEVSNTPAQSPPRQAAQGGDPYAPKLGPASCKLDLTRVGSMRRVGKAHVRLEGPGVKVDVKDAPALCGPMYDRDSDSLGVRAGDGVLFESCLPQGLVQLAAMERKAGLQTLHSSGEPGGMDVLFNKNGGATYSARGASDDKVLLSPDYWRADATLTLRDERDSSQLTGSIVFDCGP